MVDHSNSVFTVYQNIGEKYEGALGDEFKETFDIRLSIKGPDIKDDFNWNNNGYINVFVWDDAKQASSTKVKFKECKSEDQPSDKIQESSVCLDGKEHFRLGSQQTLYFPNENTIRFTYCQQ